MFTQYTQGPERELAARNALKWDAPVDFIDKLAGTDEVVLRLRRLMGVSPRPDHRRGRNCPGHGLRPGPRGGRRRQPTGQRHPGDEVRDIQGTGNRLVSQPRESGPFLRLERYSEGEDPRASLRVRIREIKDSLGRPLGTRFGPDELILNVRDRGYRLSPPGDEADREREPAWRWGS